MKSKLQNLDYKWWCGIILLLVLTIASLFLYCRSNCKSAYQKHFQKDYPFLDPVRSLYNQEDMIVNIQPLRDELNEIGNDPEVSIYFEFMPTGANISVNKDLKIWPASLMKIPIAMAAMRKIEKGEWSENEKFILKEEDRNSGMGNLYQSPIGTVFTLDYLLKEMLGESDNTARTILIRNLKMAELGEVLDHLGVEFDYRNDDQITAKRYSIFWRSLFSSSYLTPESSQKLIEIMLESSAKDYLASGIPNEVKFSHKIGLLFDENIYADSGIVYLPGRPYILTVMIMGHSQEESKNIMKNISEKIYQYISNYR